MPHTPGHVTHRENPTLFQDRYYWLTLALALVIFSATLTYPFNNDNALYAYMAELHLHGHMPYVGSWDQNFPVIIGLHAIQIALFGHTQFAFHVWDILLQLIGSTLLYYIATLLSGGHRRAGMLAALLAALYYVQQGLWMAGERDTYVSILMLAAFALVLKNPKRILLAGLCSGAAFLFRPTYGLYLIAIPVWILLTNQSGKWKQLLHFATGWIALPLLLILVYAMFGGLTDLYEATILFNLRIYANSGAQFSIWEPVRFYWPAAIVALIGAWTLWRTGNSSALMLISLLFLANVISLILLYRHSVYHYHPAMTCLLLLSAVGWQALIARINSKSLQSVAVAIIFFFFIAQTIRGNTIKHVISDLAAGRAHFDSSLYNYYEPSPEFGVAVQQEVADYLAAHAPEHSLVQMFGPYSYPQYASGMATASRFQTLHAITMRGTGGTLQDFQLRWRQEYLSSMKTTPPVYFIVCDAPEAFRQYYGGRLGHEILRDDFTELGQWLAGHYNPETKRGAFTLYRLHTSSQ